MSLGLSALKKERTGCSFGLFLHRSWNICSRQEKRPPNSRNSPRTSIVLPAAEAKEGVTQTVTPVSEGEGMSHQPELWTVADKQTGALDSPLVAQGTPRHLADLQVPFRGREVAILEALRSCDLRWLDEPHS